MLPMLSHAGPDRFGIRGAACPHAMTMGPSVSQEDLLVAHHSVLSRAVTLLFAETVALRACAQHGIHPSRIDLSAWGAAAPFEDATHLLRGQAQAGAYEVLGRPAPMSMMNGFLLTDDLVRRVRPLLATLPLDVLPSLRGTMALLGGTQQYTPPASTTPGLSMQRGVVMTPQRSQTAQPQQHHPYYQPEIPQQSLRHFAPASALAPAPIAAAASPDVLAALAAIQATLAEQRAALAGQQAAIAQLQQPSSRKSRGGHAASHGGRSNKGGQRTRLPSDGRQQQQQQQQQRDPIHAPPSKRRQQQLSEEPSQPRQQPASGRGGTVISYTYPEQAPGTSPPTGLGGDATMTEAP